MMRRLLIFIFAVVCTASVHAQLELKEFKLDAKDLSAVQLKRTYGNNMVCALVKVGLNEQDVIFEGDIIGEPEFKDGEYWVYFPQGATWLNIKTKKYSPLRYDFPEPLQSKRTYIMTVSKPVLEDEPKGFIEIESNVINASVYIDDKKMSSVTPYRYEGGEGKHVIKLQADGYVDAMQEVEVKLNVTTNVRINMDAVGSLSYKGVSYGMVSVSNVTFQMGSTAFYYEQPVRNVSLRPYNIGKRPVSVALWNQIMGTNNERNNGANGIVVNITYQECQDFITLLNKATNKNYRLPTEAEWEYAVQHKAELGIEDIGSCMEWCSDWFGRYSQSETTNPTGPETGVVKVVRGGSLDESATADKDERAWYDRPTYRWHQNPTEPSERISLRLVEDN